MAGSSLARSELAEESPGETSSEICVFGPGYLVVDVISAHPRGAVFRALDVQQAESVALKVLKQGHPHHMSDEYGRDVRDRLRRQETLHKRLVNCVPLPAADSYF
jgi:hypothetical protein